MWHCQLPSTSSWPHSQQAESEWKDAEWHVVHPKQLACVSSFWKKIYGWLLEHFSPDLCGFIGIGEVPGSEISILIPITVRWEYIHKDCLCQTSLLTLWTDLELPSLLPASERKKRKLGSALVSGKLRKQAVVCWTVRGRPKKHVEQECQGHDILAPLVGRLASVPFPDASWRVAMQGALPIV